MSESDKMSVLEKAFSQIYGLPCWKVRKGHGSFLTMEFGQPELKIREPTTERKRRSVNVRGEWHFWVYCCTWNYYVGGQLFCHCESSDEQIRQAARNLEGQALVSASVTPKLTKFEFDLGGCLLLQPYTFGIDDDETIEMWMLYTPSGEVYTLRADGRYRFQPRDDKSEEEWGSL